MGQRAGLASDCTSCATCTLREKPNNPIQEVALVRVSPRDVSEVQKLRRENAVLAARCADARGEAVSLRRANQELQEKKELQDCQSQVLMQKLQHDYEALQAALSHGRLAARREGD